MKTMTKILMPEEHHCPLGCPRSMLFIVTNQSEGVSMFGVCMYGTEYSVSSPL
jgi:hypothetical protein